MLIQGIDGPATLNRCGARRGVATRGTDEAPGGRLFSEMGLGVFSQRRAWNALQMDVHTMGEVFETFGQISKP
ncbi:hypothetical protein SAMN05216421_2374 [Halopseudomonas xinjiangensis]|uniref:Uncharacterized protein n=1 Tax=Halopseudomonas xinjiangensis TaxID=487184 RepID=A0A1H1VTF8_9GAMM|nr:hypothetical protein SAMN05216421_2374 [Halopseudomonas xinjiangensis]